MIKFFVYTWDTDRQLFTPQAGVRCGPYTKWGLRKALRKLQDIGYQVDRGSPSVLVVKEDKARSHKA